MRISSMMNNGFVSKNESKIYNSVIEKYMVRDFSKSKKSFRRNNPELASIYADIEAARKRLRRQNDILAKMAIKRDIKEMFIDYEWMMNFRNKLMCLVVC